MPTFDQIKNRTWISPVNAIPRTYPSGMFATRLIPVEYYIWLQLNDTAWVSVGPQYWATDNPPYALPSPAYWTEQVGFLGTGLPTTYVIIMIIVIITTLLTSILVRRKMAKNRPA